MTCSRVVGIFIIAVTVPLTAARTDPRLAKARTAWVEPVDELDDDRGVATCFADHLSEVTPLARASTKAEADVILKVKAHITSGASRVVLGMMGGTPSANVEAVLPNGTKIWSDGAKYRRGNGTIGIGADPRCGLANRLLNTLLDAMKKARDGR